MSSLLGEARAAFEAAWQARSDLAGPPSAVAPRTSAPPSFAAEEAVSALFGVSRAHVEAPPTAVRFDPATVAAVARYASAVKAAAQSGAAISAATLRGDDPPESRALLRASAANGVALASIAVNLAAIDAAVLEGGHVFSLSDDRPRDASVLEPGVVEAFVAASPASPDDDAHVESLLGVHPEVGLRALLEYAAAGEQRAASFLRRLGDSSPFAGALADARARREADARATDFALLELLRARSIHAVADVLALMQKIDELLPAGDGLKSFNLLYLMVTQGVSDRTGSTWENIAWIDRLDVLFGELYFGGIERCLVDPDCAPLAWRALMDRRRQPGLARIEFALAGMSAHILRDLAVAVVLTWQAANTVGHGHDTPEYRDFKRVDGLLDAVEPRAMVVLATGIFKVLDDLFGHADDWAAMQIIHNARELAWWHAEALHGLGLESAAGKAYVDGLDSVAAGFAIAAMVPIQ